jgi:membrane-bound lytic murein transglycosylase MltF
MDRFLMQANIDVPNVDEEIQVVSLSRYKERQKVVHGLADGLRTENRLTIPICVLLLGSLSCWSGGTTDLEAEPPRSDSLVAADAIPAGLMPEAPVWWGDYDEMLDRRIIRALVSYSKTHYFLDGARPRGLAFEALSEFERFVNQRERTGTLPINVVIIPVRRDALMPALAEGRGDLAAANLTATESRRQKVDFSEPLMRNVAEVLVVGPAGPDVSDLSSLGGETVYVRRSSSYYRSVTRLSDSLQSIGVQPVEIVAVNEYLEDEDLLEMVDGGLIPATVVDRHKADFWSGVYENLRVLADYPIRDGGSIAWAVRKETPQFMAVVNEFVERHRQGTLFGNVVFNRYLADASRISNPRSEEELARLAGLSGYFQRFAAQYGHDWLLLAAQGYQESRLDQSRRSRAGAINVDVPDVHKVEDNIHAAAKYLAFIRDRYFSGSEIDSLNRQLLTLAAYNAGPGRIVRLQRVAAAQGLDPNKWFRNVELAAARDIGRETVQYVSNVYKYYITYRELARWPQVRRSGGLRRKE